VRYQNGDSILSFGDFPWHEHGDLLALASSLNPDDAIDAFLAKLFAGDLIIGISKVGGVIGDIWATDDAVGDFSRRLPNETIDFRLWDGTKITP
jgi:hypothetical protein